MRNYFHTCRRNQCFRMIYITVKEQIRLPVVTFRMLPTTSNPVKLTSVKKVVYAIFAANSLVTPGWLKIRMTARFVYYLKSKIMRSLDCKCASL